LTPLVEFACQFGVESIPDRLLNDDVMYILQLEADKINAYKEARVRSASGPLTADGIYNLVLRATGDLYQAELMKAKFINEERKHAARSSGQHQ
jgi:hypothetical protein